MMIEHGKEPVRYWVIDRWAETPAERIPCATWPGWEAKYDNDCERGKQTTRDLSTLPEYASLLARMRAELVEFQAQDDPTLHGGGLHVMRPGGVLACHLDYDRHPLIEGKRRALNLIFFAHPHWQAEWGGQFYLADPSGAPKVMITPRPGRLIAFETNDLSYHGVRPIQGPEPRISLAVYGLQPATATSTRTRALFVPPR